MYGSPPPRIRHVLALSLLAAAVLRAPAAASATTPLPGARLDATSFEEPTKSAETLLHVQGLGRYALISEGSQGARIELVDRMAGVMASQGRESGVEATSGRIDAFLEPGDYKVRISKQATGGVSLAVRTYATANAGADPWAVPILRDRETVTGELQDLELLCWWVRLDASDPTLVVELEGRSLVDAALWKDGVWDTGLRPLSRTFEPEPGKPVTALEFNSRLEPGLYLLVCAGGPGRPWAGAATRDDFSISRGSRFLGSMGITTVTFGERGIETFLVGPSADFFQLSARNNRDYSVSVAPNQPGSSRFDYRRTARIDSKSSSYRASVSGRTGGNTQWVTVQGPPGETVEVRWFPSLPAGGGDAYPVDPGQQSRPYMMTVLGAADGEESVDLTGLELAVSETEETFAVGASSAQCPGLGAGQPLHRRLNLLSRLSFLLRVETAGSYAVVEAAESRAAAKYRFLLLDDWVTGEEEVKPVEAVAGDRVQLQAKIYVVTLVPTGATAEKSGAGILDFAIIPSGAAPLPPPGPQANALYWPRLGPGDDGERRTALVLTSRSGVPAGGAARALPLDLAAPVFVKVDAGSLLELPFECQAPVRLYSTNPEFSTRTVRVDGVPWAAEDDVAAGMHRLAVSNAAATGQWYLIGALPAVSVAAFETPRFESAEDVLPTFTEGAPIWRDFGRSERATFLLTVTEPASYRIATAGRLSMAITVRTPLKPSLFSASQNADGRNAVITAYLRPGTYLVQVQAQGASQGRAGLLLQRQEVLRAGTLTAGSISRRTVPAGVLASADVKIEAETDYRLECLGLGRSFSWRFEDADGWPIGPPVASGALTMRLSPGTYHYISAAADVSTRRLVSLGLAGEPRAAYDPKAKEVAIELDRAYTKTWVEAEGRPEDIFTLNPPAALRLRLFVSKGMLYRVLDAKGATILTGQGGTTRATELPAGPLAIAVKSAEVDNLKDYQLLVEAIGLYEGGARAITGLPQPIPVTVGKPGTVELWSYGTQEADAYLLDSTGATVARGEAIPDDWNFRIVANLAPGRYLLSLVAPGSALTPPQSPLASPDSSVYPFTRLPASLLPGPGASVVRCESRPTLALGPSAGSLETAREISTEVAFSTFTAKAAGVFRFDAQSDVPVSASVARGGRVLATGPCPVLLPIAAAVPYEVRFWQSSGERRKILLRVSPQKSVDATVASAGVTVDAREAVLRVIAPLAAGFEIAPEADGVRYSPGTDVPFAPVAGEAFGTVSGVGWVARADGAPVGRVAVSPLALSGGEARAFHLGPVRQSFTVVVPPRTVAVLRTDNAGRPIGMSASPAASFASGAFDLRGASITPRASALGLREGSFRGLLWDAAPAGAAEGRAAAAAAFYPEGAAKALAMGQRLQETVPPRSAVSFKLASSSQSVRVSLEQGMSAFAWAGKPAGFLDAQGGAATGQLEAQGGSVVVVNESARPGICVVEAGVSRAQAPITGAAGFEAMLAESRFLSFPVSTDPASRIYLWGSAASARLLREDDGRIYPGETSTTDYGPVLSFPGGKGRLEVTAAGLCRIWAAKPAASRAGFVARGPVARNAALGAAGAALGQGPEAWTFALGAKSIVTVAADSGGVTAIYDKSGALVAVSAGERSRTVLAALAAGSYTAFTRPFKGGAQSGAIRVQTLAAENLEADGEGEAVLIGPRERKLYRFQVAVAGRVGVGVRAGSETLAATLYDKDFRPVGSGTIFIRSLEAGSWLLLVESGDSTVSFAPVVYGLAGNRTGVPDDVIRTYTQE